MAAHRYWRVNVSSCDGARGEEKLQVVEFQFRETAGVSQTFSGGTSSASSEFSASFNAAKASDDNATTRWSCAASVASAWWKYDYGSGVTKDIVEVTIRIPTTSDDAAALRQAPRNFTLEWSDDDSAWTVAATMTEVSPWTSGETKTFTLPLSPLPVKVSQVVVESALDGDSISVSQLVAEAALSGQTVNVSQIVMESVLGTQHAKVSQVVMESVLGKQFAKVSQVVLEVIYEYVEDTRQPVIWVMT